MNGTEILKLLRLKFKNYDQEFLSRKFQKCQQIENKLFRVGEVSFHNQKLILITKAFSGDDNDENQDDDLKSSDLKSFEQLITHLPQMINKNNTSNSRDTITVKNIIINNMIIIYKNANNLKVYHLVFLFPLFTEFL